MSELTDTLLSRRHPATAGGHDRSAAAFIDAIVARKHVLIRLPGTRGGTEVSFPLDERATDLSAADLRLGTGTVHLEGDLTVDFEVLRCVVEVDLATLAGSSVFQPAIPVRQPQVIRQPQVSGGPPRCP